MAGPDLTYTPGPDLTYTPDTDATESSKKPRSAIAEIANQGYAGVVADLPEMVGKAAQYATNPGDAIYGWGKGIADAAKARGAQPDLQPDPENHNIVTNTLASGARMIPQSLAPAAAVGGVLAAAPVSVPGALLIGSALGSLPAAMSQGQTTLDKAEEAGVGRDVAIPAARKTALIEGAGETLGTFAGAKLLGLGGKALSTTLARATGKAEGSAAGHVLADATDASVLKPWLKQIPETLATEVGTEMGQNAGEAYIEQQAGIDKQTPWDAAKEAVGPTIGMTALLAPFGLAGFGIRAKQNARRAETLTSADAAPGDRLKAAFEIKTQLDEIDPEAGKNFGEHVLQAIEDQTPLEIGEHLFAPPVVTAPTQPLLGYNSVIIPEVPRSDGQGAAPIDPTVGPLSAAAADAIKSGLTPTNANRVGTLLRNYATRQDAQDALDQREDGARMDIISHPRGKSGFAVVPKDQSALAKMDLEEAKRKATTPTPAQDEDGGLALAGEDAQAELQMPQAQPVAEMPARTKMGARMTEAARLAAVQRNAAVQDEESAQNIAQPPGVTSVPKADQAQQTKPSPQAEADSARVAHGTPTPTFNAQPTTLGSRTNAVAGPGYTARDLARIQNPQAPAAGTQAQAAPDQTTEAMAGDAAATDELPGAGSTAVQADGVKVPERTRYYVTKSPAYDGIEPLSVEDADFELEALENSAKKGRLTPEVFALSEIGKRLDAATIIGLQPSLKTNPVGTIQALRSHIANKAEPVSQPTQPITGEGAGVAKPKDPRTIKLSQRTESTNEKAPEAIQSAAQRPQAPAATNPAQPAASAGVAAAVEADTAQPATESVAKPAKTKKPAGGKSLRAAAYDRNPLLTFLATHGLFHDKDKPNIHKAEFSPDKAIMVMGYGPVFKKTGKRLDELTQNAIEEGYLPTDGTESQLRELVRRAVAGEKISPLYAEGVAEQIAEQNFAEHLAQQQEAAQNEDFDDPFGPMLDGDFVADDFDVPGYDEASDPIKLEVNALLALADDAGINEDARELIKEDAHYATLDQSEQAYYEAYRNALKAAIAASNRVGSADSGEASNAQGQREASPPEISGSVSAVQSSQKALEAGQAEIDEAKGLKYKLPYLEDRLKENLDPTDGFDMHILANELPPNRAYNRMMTDHNGDFSGVEFKNKDGRHAFVLPDASQPGKWRVSYFDKDGFSRHESEPTREKAQQSLARDGYTIEDKGALDRLASTKEWARGTDFAGLIFQLNSGAITHAQFIEKQNKLNADYEASKGEGLTLTAPTREEVLAQQAQAEQAAKDKDTADRKADKAAREEDERKRIAKASEAAAGTFELGGNALDNLTGQGGLFANEPTVSYNGDYETDLFGEPLPAATGKDSSAKPIGKGVRGDVQPRTGVQDTQAPVGEYHVNTIVGTVSKREIGASRILTAKQAAQATRYLYKSAVERFDAIVTDSRGKPLAVVGGFKGAPTQTSVYPVTVMGEAIRVPGAAYIWFSHNHPSGNSTLSRADENLNRMMSDIFRGSGIESMGTLAVSDGTFSHVGADGSIYASNASIGEATGSVKVPVIERELAPSKAAPEAISDPIAAKALGRRLYEKAQAPGIMLLTAQNSLAAWVPISNEMFGPLRNTGGLAAIYRAVSQSNASAAIIVHGGELDVRGNLPANVSASENIAAALVKVDVRPLDSINAVTNKSVAEQGLDVAKGPMFAREALRRASTPRLFMPISEVQQAVDQLTAKWKDGPRVKVVATPDELPIDAPNDARGLIHDGTVYIVAANHRDRDGVARTLGHEAIGHYGLWKMLGEDGTRQFQAQLQLALKSGNVPLNKIAATVRGLYVDQNGKFNLSPRQEANEIAAFAVESAIDADGNFKPGFGFFKAVWAKVAQFLRDLGIAVQFTNAELQGMLVSSMKGLETGERLEGGGRSLAAAALGGQQSDSGLSGITIKPAAIVEKSIKAMLSTENATAVLVTGGNSDVLYDIARKFGKQIVFFREVQDGGPQNGQMGAFTGNTGPDARGDGKGQGLSEFVTNGFTNASRPDVVFLNVDSSNHLLYILGHEFGHTLRTDDRKLWVQMAKELQPLVRNWSGYKANSDQVLSTDDAYAEELFGDVIGQNFLNPEFWQDMAQQSPPLFSRIANKAIALLNKAARLVIGRDASPFISDMEKARSVVAGVLAQYAAARDANDHTAPDSGGAFARGSIVGSTNDYSQDMLKVMDKLGWQVEVPTLKERAQALWKDAGKKLAQGIADQFAPVKDLDGKAYGLLRLAKGASGAFETLLKGGKLKLTDNVYDIDTANRGGVVDKLLIPLQGEHHNFFRWVAAQRAALLKQVGKEHLFDQSDIDTINKWANTTDAKFDYTIQNGVRKGQTTRNRAEMYRDSNIAFSEFNKNVLDMAEQSGLIDGSTRHLWENEFYVPFYRVSDDADGGVRGMNIKGAAVRQQAFKALKGGKQKLNADLLENTLMNWAHLLDASAKNRAAKATIEAAEKMGVAMGGNQSALASMGSTVGNRNGVVWFMDGGQKRYSLIDNQGDGPYIMTALSSLEYAGMRNPVMNAMGAMKHALTVGVTASPFFKVRNLIRDSVQVIGTGPISYNVGKNLVEGWKLTDPKSDEYFRLLVGGGTIHFGTMTEGSEAKRVQALVESGVDGSTILDSDHKLKAFYRKFIEPGITAYNELGNRGEAVNRAALYNQLRKQGIGHAEASLQARDLMDFSMQGSWTSIRFLTQVVPFMNARIQGLYKLGKAAKTDPARFSLVLGATAMASLALLGAYGDDDDWKKRTESDRNNFWWFKVGGTAFRIPKPFEIGSIGTLAERGLELAFDKEMDSKRFGSQVLAILSDQLSMNPVPQLVKPILDVYANIDSFSGTPIENMAQQKLKSEYRFNDKTTMAARGASTAMNAVTGLIGKEALSPVEIDHLLRGYFGWLGTMVVSAGDYLARPATGQPDQAREDYLKKLTGNMASDLRDAPSRYVNQMYTQAKTNMEAYDTWRALMKEQKPEEAKEFFAGNKQAIVDYRRTEAAKKSETLFNNMMRMVERNRELDPDQKRERIRVIQAQKEAVAKRAVLTP